MNKKLQTSQNNFFEPILTTFFDDADEPQLWKYKGFDDCDSCYWKKSFLDLIELIEMFVQSVDEIRSRRY